MLQEMCDAGRLLEIQTWLSQTELNITQSFIATKCDLSSSGNSSRKPTLGELRHQAVRRINLGNRLKLNAYL